MTTAAELKAAVSAAEAAIKQANQACWAAKAEAERACNAAKAPSEATLAALKKAHQARALELAIEANECPYETWGSHMDPHDVTVREDGIWLSWDINGDYAPQTFFASWETLLGTVEAGEEASA